MLSHPESGRSGCFFFICWRLRLRISWNPSGRLLNGRVSEDSGARPGLEPDVASEIKASGFNKYKKCTEVKREELKMIRGCVGRWSVQSIYERRSTGKYFPDIIIIIIIMLIRRVMKIGFGRCGVYNPTNNSSRNSCLRSFGLFRIILYNLK